jgi:hypothetical protein
VAAKRARAGAGLPGLCSDAIACSQACALALVEREIAAVETMMRDGKRWTQFADANTESLPRRAAYVHLVASHSEQAARG